ncbi:MAG: bacterial regulatory s, gntR family protein [Bradyrhizobium sp.]|nr:bacterial regulatory s, gntR family protein [Bradyrhizobium sp.]
MEAFHTSGSALHGRSKALRMAPEKEFNLSIQFTGRAINSRSNAEAVRVPKTAELVARQIRNAIIRGQLNDGDTLPAEAQLIAEFEVSRPTVREAVRILESEGLITVARGARGGAKVSSPNYEMVARAAGITLQAQGATIGDVYEMRMMIEPPAARLVAERNSVEGGKVLRAHLETEYTLVKDRFAESLAIARFHRMMIELAGNATLAMVAHALQGLFERHLQLAQRREPSEDAEYLERRTRFGLKSHAKLIDLIEARDGAAAEAHWKAHMVAAGKVWLAEVGPTALVDLLD